MLYVVKQEVNAWITPTPCRKFEPNDAAFEMTWIVRALTTEYLLVSIIVIIYLLLSSQKYIYFSRILWYRILLPFGSETQCLALDSYHRIALWFLKKMKTVTILISWNCMTEGHVILNTRTLFKLHSSPSLHSLKHKLHQYHSLYTNMLIDIINNNM